jgi:methyl-accepting chemotaxis protein
VEGQQLCIRKEVPMESPSPSEEQAVQRKEALEELATGIDRLHHHQQEIADHLQQEHHHVAEIQDEVAEEAEAARDLRDHLKPRTEPENAP